MSERKDLSDLFGEWEAEQEADFQRYLTNPTPAEVARDAADRLRRAAENATAAATSTDEDEDADEEDEDDYEDDEDTDEEDGEE